PAKRLVNIAVYTAALVIQRAKVVLRYCVIAESGALKPFRRLGRIPLNTAAFQVHCAQLSLSIGIAEPGGFPQPVRRLTEVLLHAVAVFQSEPEPALNADVSGKGARELPGYRRIARNTLRSQVRTPGAGCHKQQSYLDRFESPRRFCSSPHRCLQTKRPP